ncbi:PRK06851 family protein [Bacillus sp. 1P06AnD]|uniref:PRK06851 family protein n=1 Tax=Bacillus sp. 1P06AnD TaxID=3132208 RepID=UPI0039A08C41
MSEQIRHYFAGGNTAYGFHSLYDSNLAGLKKVFILKGGPGTGKSTMMKEIANIFEEQGYSLQILHCSSDNNSIDGVIINELRVGIVDGTAPHVIEPKLPGAVEQYVNVGEAWDSQALSEKKDQIEQLMEDISNSYEAAYSSFAAALKIHDEWEAIFIDKMDFDKANALTEELVDQLYGQQRKEKISDVRHRFLGAATPDGAVDFVPNLTGDVERRYFIKGRPGSGKSTMLKAIASEAELRGYDVEIYHCGFDPNSLDMVIVRELGFAIFDSTAPHEYFPSRAGDEVIDVYERCIEAGTDEDYKTDIEHVSKRYRAKMDEATAFLASAKKRHDQLEQLYIECMDFTKVTELKDGMVDLIQDMVSI